MAKQAVSSNPEQFLCEWLSMNESGDHPLQRAHDETAMKIQCAWPDVSQHVDEACEFRVAISCVLVGVVEKARMGRLSLHRRIRRLGEREVKHSTVQ